MLLVSTVTAAGLSGPANIVALKTFVTGTQPHHSMLIWDFFLWDYYSPFSGPCFTDDIKKENMFTNIIIIFGMS